MFWWFFIVYYGDDMTDNNRNYDLEKLRCDLNIPVYAMCNILGIDEPEYNHIIRIHSRLTIFQLIMPVDAIRKSIE